MADAATADDPYDLSDATPAPQPVAPTAQPVEAALPPRDPETGQFLPREQPVAAEPAPATNPQAPAHPSYLIDQARELGFSEEEITEAPTGVLTRAVVRAYKDRAGHAEQLARFQARDVPRAAEPSPEPPDEEVSFGAFEEQLDPQFSGTLKSEFRKLRAEMKELKALKAELQALKDRESYREGESVADKIDRFFSTQDKAIFGDGDRHALETSSAEMARRVAVVDEAKRRAGPKATVPQVLATLSVAAKTLFGKPAPSKPPKAVPEPSPAPRAGITPEDWEAGALARPTNRRGAPEPDGTQKAVNNLAQRMRANGMLEDAQTGEELDGLPE